MGNMNEKDIEVLKVDENSNKQTLKKKTTKQMKKKKLSLLLVLLLLTGMLLGLSTYAWFTANKTVSTSDIQVNVAAQNGIQISADGTNWKAIVQIADLTGAKGTYPAAVNQIPDKSSSIEPVSSGLNVDAKGQMEMFYGAVDTNDDGRYILTSTKETDAHAVTGKYVAFDLFFKADMATDLFLTSASGVSSDGNDTGIKNASRVGFIDLGNTPVGSDLPTIQGLNAGTSAPIYTWEPNFDTHTAAAVAHAKDTYNITTTTTGAPLLAYSGVIAPITRNDNVLLGDATQTANSTLFKDIVPTYSTAAGFSTSKQVFSLAAGITKVRIYMWVEGQDVDCENTASGGNIIYNLQMSSQA